MAKMTDTKKTVIQLSCVVLTMGALAWASVPFYNWFCRVTGFGGVTGVAQGNSDVILDKTIKIRFDGSLDRNMPWEFKPMQREMELRIGETGLAFFEAYNPTDHPIAGQAAYNVTPYEAGGFFRKDRVLLLYRAGAATRRAGRDASDVLRRSRDCHRPRRKIHPHDHAVLHILRDRHA